MIRIIIVRHGKPLLPPQTPISSIYFANWIRAYDSAKLCKELMPHHEVVSLAQNCEAVICSQLSRSIDSAQLLGIQHIYRCEYDLREMEMPSGQRFSFVLRPKYWAVIFRVLWFFGYSNNSESFKDAKLRAEQAAVMLERIAKEKHSVLFVGHGLLNRFIAKILIRRGWQMKKQLGSNYWDFGIFERHS